MGVAVLSGGAWCDYYRLNWIFIILLTPFCCAQLLSAATAITLITAHRQPTALAASALCVTPMSHTPGVPCSCWTMEVLLYVQS